MNAAVETIGNRVGAGTQYARTVPGSRGTTTEPSTRSNIPTDAAFERETAQHRPKEEGAQPVHVSVLLPARLRRFLCQLTPKVPLSLVQEFGEW